MPFQAGDKVVVVRSSSAAGGYLKMDVEFTVSRFDPERYALAGGAVYLQEHPEHGWKQDRFKLAEVREPVFAVGVEVERTGPDTISTHRGQKYTIETIYPDELGGVQFIKLVGINTRYHVRDFKPLPKAEFNRAEWVPQVGEQVYITGKDEYSNGARMDAFINDGVVYVIQRLTERDSGKVKVHLDDHPYMYLSSSLTPVKAVNGGKRAAPPPPLELREALYEKCKKEGLGTSLCAYSFETATGKQYHHPYICHAMLSNSYGEIVKMAYGFRQDMARAKSIAEAHKVYANYIISQSPWKEAFITQDIEEAIAKDILMNVEVNRFIMAGACVALRTGQEYQDRPVIFKEMLDRGHNPHTCWLISCAFSRIKEGQYAFNSWTGGHDVIDKYRNFSQVVKFFQTGYHVEKAELPWSGYKINPLTKDPFRTHHGRYAIASTIADNRDKTPGETIGEWFEANTVKGTVGIGWDKKTVIDEKALDDVATKLDKLIKGQV